VNPLQSLPEYEHFIYTLSQRYPTVRRSTLIVIRRGAATAVLTGEVELGGYRLVAFGSLKFGQVSGIVVSSRYDRDAYRD
jgi:hypothetical protein